MRCLSIESSFAPQPSVQFLNARRLDESVLRPRPAYFNMKEKDSFSISTTHLRNNSRSYSALLQPRRLVALGATCLAVFYLLFRLGSKKPLTFIDDGQGRAGSVSAPSTHLYPNLPDSKYAYAAFLAPPETESENDDDDNYFVATRILAYQLLHDPVTATNNSIPFLVLVTQEVHETKRRRLEADGATIVPVELLTFDWISPGRNRWRHVLSKLHLWELTQYERICFLDSDMLIIKPLDGIFDDPAVSLVFNLNKTDKIEADEITQPTSYVFAGVSGQGGYNHALPPHPGGTANAGFVVLKPSIEMFNYYLSVGAIKGRFDSTYPEQHLWRYAHRKDGNMPWKQLTTTWNVNWATMKDYHGGIASLHSKWWNVGPDEELRKLAFKMRWMMEGSAQARDKIALLGRP